MLREFREKYGLSTEQLADGAKVSHELVKQLEGAEGSGESVPFDDSARVGFMRLYQYMLSVETQNIAEAYAETPRGSCSSARTSSDTEEKQARRAYVKYANNSLDITRTQNGFVVSTPSPRIHPQSIVSLLDFEIHRDYVCDSPDALLSVMMHWAYGKTLKQVAALKKK